MDTPKGSLAGNHLAAWQKKMTAENCSGEEICLEAVTEGAANGRGKVNSTHRKHTHTHSPGCYTHSPGCHTHSPGTDAHTYTHTALVAKSQPRKQAKRRHATLLNSNPWPQYGTDTG